MDDKAKRAIALWRLGVLGALVSARLEHGEAPRTTSRSSYSSTSSPAEGGAAVVGTAGALSAGASFTTKANFSAGDAHPDRSDRRAFRDAHPHGAPTAPA
jgi:hypothetical protein